MHFERTNPTFIATVAICSHFELSLAVHYVRIPNTATRLATMQAPKTTIPLAQALPLRSPEGPTVHIYVVLLANS